MDEHVEVTAKINGETVTRRVEARQHLVDFLRTVLGLTGSHVGCEHGVCGDKLIGPSCSRCPDNTFNQALLL